jgi:hypothetical protein
MPGLPSMDPALAQLLCHLLLCGKPVQVILAADPEPGLMCLLNAWEPMVALGVRAGIMKQPINLGRLTTWLTPSHCHDTFMFVRRLQDLTMNDRRLTSHASVQEMGKSLIHYMLFITVFLTSTSVRAQSDEVREILKGVNRSWSDANELLERSARENRNYVSRLTCQELINEAKAFERRGDYWRNQDTVGSNPSARGSYEAAEMRYQEFNRRCWQELVTAMASCWQTNFTLAAPLSQLWHCQLASEIHC